MKIVIIIIKSDHKKRCNDERQTKTWFYKRLVQTQMLVKLVVIKTRDLLKKKTLT